MEADDDVELTITSTTLPSQRESTANGKGDPEAANETAEKNDPLSQPSLDSKTGDDDLSQLERYEKVFLVMQHRILERELGGSEKQRSSFYIVGVVVVFILLYLSELAEEGAGVRDKVVLNVRLRDLIGYGIAALIIILIANNVPPRYFTLFCVMVIYWPILIIAAYFVISDNFKDRFVECYMVLLGFEVLTLGYFIYCNVLYPRLILSEFFQKRIGAARFWNMEVVDDWTFEYSRSRFWKGPLCKKRYRCRYNGELNSQTGLPHGMGVWSDNSHYGEILTGMWNNGIPIAPFKSRQYGGQGNMVTAQRIAFFMATDDPFTKCNTFPTNKDPPRCGVAVVETSVAGGFYHHLPRSTLLSGFKTEDSSRVDEYLVPESAELGTLTRHHTLRNPQSLGTESGTLSIGECLEIADKGKSSSASDRALQTLQISCNDPRGIQVSGHRYGVTGNPFTHRVQQLVIDVVPRKSPEEKDDDDEDELAPLVSSATDESKPFAASGVQFDVKDWRPVKGKDTVVIYIPGFNAWLQASLNTVGQMFGMMDTIRSKVHPVIYAFPGATIMTYRGASTISASENNKKYFLQMLLGLKKAGYKNIHIMTHSLGVQTLMSVFEDEIHEDGRRSPSVVSKCFTTAPKARSHEEQYRARDSMIDVNKLVCRSITLLHPDYSLNAFREHGFKSIRRVCSLITIVGDRADFALFASMLLNGICNSLKLDKATVYRSKAEDAENGFHFQKATGRDIDGLYANEEDKDNAAVLKFCRESSVAAGLASSANTPSVAAAAVSTHQECDLSEHEYLDCDVIDVTGLDANVNDMRHSAFSMNSIVTRDMEELILTCKRASGRSSPLHKKGNIYEYCHAPVFVKPKK